MYFKLNTCLSNVEAKANFWLPLYTSHIMADKGHAYSTLYMETWLGLHYVCS